jgi:hypothetical protein
MKRDQHTVGAGGGGTSAQNARVNVALPARDDVVGVADVPVPIRRTRNEGATGLIPRVITATVQLPSWSIPWKLHTRLAPMVGVPSTPMCTNGLRVQPSTSIRDRRTARVPRTGTTEGSPAAMAAAVVAESASETGSRPPSTSREPWSARPNRTSTYDRRSCPKPGCPPDAADRSAGLVPGTTETGRTCRRWRYLPPHPRQPDPNHPTPTQSSPFARFGSWFVPPS